ncbi:MAG TPA: AAA family ATPase [Streptosporangiaceae bacterium]|nr:AAA family ATPase [Streptosporangiaceae bacterium]
MLLRRIQAPGFLSFDEPTELVLDEGLTVVTGPNGVGKSNLGRCLELCRAAIGRTAGDPVADRLDLYRDAGFRGAEKFEVRVDLDLDQAWERAAVRSFVCSVFATTHELASGPDAPDPSDLDLLARKAIPEESLVPLARRFTLEQLNRPVELRDGSGVAAELYRLKNGNARDNARYEEIAQTFAYLTKRTLGLRSHPAAPDSELGPGMIIEPTVVDGYGERPVEFAGAGVQEALVLSALLLEEPGRIVVLDEPAVNLEPTMQRRLIGKLRETGQCLVITHSADLVPVDSPTDLDRIIRLAAGPKGTQIHRPDLRGSDAREALSWLRLLEPAHVRAGAPFRSRSHPLRRADRSRGTATLVARYQQSQGP